MDKKQQFLHTVSLGNQAKSRILTKYRIGSQNVEIETSSHGLVGNPSTPFLQTTYRRQNQSTGMFHWVQPVSLQDVYFHSDNSGNRSPRGSPVSLLSHWCESKRERNKSCYHWEVWFHGRQPHSWSNAELDLWVWMDVPFASLWLVWVHIKRDLTETLGHLLPLPQCLWQHVT